MALDRVIRFPRLVPGKAGLRSVLEDYFGGCGEIEDQGAKKIVACFLVTLPGYNSGALRRAKCASKAYVEAAQEQEEEHQRGRWIEIYLHPAGEEWPACVYVTTRQHDEFTNAIAEGLADVLMRGWRGERLPG